METENKASDKTSKGDLIRLSTILFIILGSVLLPLFAREVLFPNLKAWKEDIELRQGIRREGLFAGNPDMKDSDAEDDIRALGGTWKNGRNAESGTDADGEVEDLGIIWSKEYGPGGVKLNADGSIVPDAEVVEALKSGNQNRIDRAMVSQYRRINPETVGMIRIPGTVLNHPLMQSPANEGYYLNHDFLKRENANGTPFLAASSGLATPAGNAIAYGHNIRLGRKDIFQPIAEYENINFYKAHPTVEVALPDRTVSFLVFAYFIVDTADEDTFVYWQDTYFSSEERFTQYMEEVAKRNWLGTGIVCERTDSYLTLSSCSVELARSGTNRMVLMCRALREGEKPGDYTRGACRAANPLLPIKLR